MAIPAQGTSTPGHLERNNAASAIIDGGACHHPMIVVEAMWTGMMKDIDLLHTIAEAGVGAEALHHGNDRHILVQPRVERS